jgi:hypothetical protein
MNLGSQNRKHANSIKSTKPFPTQAYRGGFHAIWFIALIFASFIQSNSVSAATSELFNVNFGAHLNPGLNGVKTGMAATGQSASDYWNIYSRDDGSGGFLVDGYVSNLKLADGTITSAGLVVNNAPGCWANGSSDPMYYSYAYPFSGNATVTMTNLLAGTYDLYVYAHDGNYRLNVGGTSYGDKTCYDNAFAGVPVWQEGRQYVRYTGVNVGSGQSLTLTVQPGVSGYAIISGLQLAVTAAPPPPTPAFLVDVDFGAGVGSSPKVGFAATGQTTNDFWNFYTRDGAGGWLTFGALSNLKLANGTPTSVGLTVDNAPGAWGNGSTDPMYNGYIYPFSGNATITVTNLPPGQYDIYAYANDGNYQVTGAADYEIKTSQDPALVSPPVWQAGVQYALFQNVGVTNSTQRRQHRGNHEYATFDNGTADQSERVRRRECWFLGYSRRNSTAFLSMATERNEHSRCYQQFAFVK